jgi:hypothetical protein
VTKKIIHVIGGPFLIFDDQVELLYISNPLQVMLFLELRLRTNKTKKMMINMKNGFLTQDIVMPFFKGSTKL